jgi:PTH1 family peptidyl-tRNA hydrolase
MRIVIGLGNPGERYAATRHNLGFLVVERAAERLGLSWVEEAGRLSLVARGRRGDESFALAKPQTFMNASGEALVQLAGQDGIDRDGLLVVLDDLDLPTGQLRIRRRGSAGGHRGLESIIASLESPEFARLRIGIGSERAQQDAADYVLAPTEDEVERARLQRSVDSACEAVILWLSWASAEDLMNRFNRRIDSNVEDDSAS